MQTSSFRIYCLICYDWKNENDPMKKLVISCNQNLQLQHMIRRTLRLTTLHQCNQPSIPNDSDIFTFFSDFLQLELCLLWLKLSCLHVEHHFVIIVLGFSVRARADFLFFYSLTQVSSCFN